MDIQHLSLSDKCDTRCDLFDKLTLEDEPEDVSMADISMDQQAPVDSTIENDIEMTEPVSDESPVSYDGPEVPESSEAKNKPDVSDYKIFLDPTKLGYRVASGRTELPTKKTVGAKSKFASKLASAEPLEADKSADLSELTVEEPDDDEEIVCLSTADGNKSSTAVDQYRGAQMALGQQLGQLHQRQPIFINNYIQNFHHNSGGVTQQPASASHSTAASSSSQGPALRTPYLISTYLQILLNATVTVFFLYQGFVFLQTVRKDIGIAVQNEMLEGQYLIKDCYRQYQINKCMDQNLPALQEQCLQWLKCMNKEPYMLINYSELMVSIWGSLINKFLESFSYKSVSFLALVVLALYLWNFSCGYVRAKSYYGLPMGHVSKHGGTSSVSSISPISSDSTAADQSLIRLH